MQWYLGTIWIIQDSLPVWRSLITTAKSFPNSSPVPVWGNIHWFQGLELAVLAGWGWGTRLGGVGMHSYPCSWKFVLALEKFLVALISRQILAFAKLPGSFLLLHSSSPSFQHHCPKPPQVLLIWDVGQLKASSVLFLGHPFLSWGQFFQGLILKSGYLFLRGFLFGISQLFLSGFLLHSSGMQLFLL